MQSPQKKKQGKIGEAVFRGERGNYTFTVYPLTVDIKDAPAVFIFSKRRIDRFKKGHHRTACLGDTTSFITELKRHRRAKCVKQNEANVVCVYRESDPVERARIVADIAAARRFECVQGVFKPVLRQSRTHKTVMRQARSTIEKAVTSKPRPARKPTHKIKAKPARAQSGKRYATSSRKRRTAA